MATEDSSLSLEYTMFYSFVEIKISHPEYNKDRNIREEIIKFFNNDETGKRIRGGYDNSQIIRERILQSLSQSIGGLFAEVNIDNYRERQGSLVIDFTLIVLGVFTTYGGIRESFDYALSDLERLFRDSNREFNVTTNRSMPLPMKIKKGKKNKNIQLLRQETELRLEEIRTRLDFTNEQIIRRLRRTNIFQALLTALLIGTIVFYLYREDGKTQSAKSETEQELLLEKKIREQIKEEKLNMLLEQNSKANKSEEDKKRKGN